MSLPSEKDKNGRPRACAQKRNKQVPRMPCFMHPGCLSSRAGLQGQDREGPDGARFRTTPLTPKTNIFDLLGPREASGRVPGGPYIYSLGLHAGDDIEDKAVELFDFIHSLDSTKLADNLQKRENEIKKKLSYFIQVNIGNEPQKGGVQLHEVESFLKYCKTNTKLNIIGLMVIPPFDTDVEKYFSEISLLNTKLGFKHLSMGMSEDYKLAIKFKSTFLRIGSAIFGPRNINK